MSQANLFELQMQLVQFGLNPNDWKIEIGRSFRALLQHKSDGNFKFLGVFEPAKKNLRWKSLEIISL